MINSHHTKWKPRLLFCVSFSLLLHFLSAQTYSLTAFRGTSLAPTSQGFYECLPADYATSGKSYPLLIVMHGAGDLGNGNDELDRVLMLGVGKRLNERTLPDTFTSGGSDFNFIIILPQLFTESGGANSINTIIDECLNRYRVMTNRVYITGCSMGGGLTWNAVGMNSSTAGRIAAIVPMAPHAPYNSANANVIAAQSLPVWSLHNHFDDVVSFELTNEWVDGINSFSPIPAARKTIFETAGHDVWTQATDPAYREGGKNIYEWMLGYTRGLDVLPVTLSSFTAKKILSGNSVQVTLNWKTASELSNSSFTLERSADGIDFDFLTSVAAGNQLTGGSYQYIDEHPLPGTSYYRLSQVDVDGSKTYFSIVPVNIAPVIQMKLSLYPNPVKELLTIDLNSSVRGSLVVKIISASGAVVQTRIINKQADQLVEQLTLTGIQAGYYFLEISGDNALARMPFLKN